MDPSHILVWNVRGLNSSARQDSVRMIVDSAKVDVVCLQETKMPSISRRMVLSMLGSEFDNNFVALPSTGASGGILLAWRAKLGAIGATRHDNFSASVRFSSAQKRGKHGGSLLFMAHREMMTRLHSCKSSVTLGHNVLVLGHSQGTSI